MDVLTWMAWTRPVALFFVCIGVMLIAMTLWEWRSPTVARKGWLPLITTRGDRLFIGLLMAAYINLAWTGITDFTQWWALAFSAIVFAALMRWG